MSSVIITEYSAQNFLIFLLMLLLLLLLVVVHHWPAIQVSRMITLAVENDDFDSDINNANERFAYNNKVNNKLTSVSHFAIVILSVRFIIYSIECRSVIDCHQLNLHGKNSHLHLCILLRILP